MESCDNCLCHLHICQAECCKEFKLIVDPHSVARKGMKFVVNNPTEDQKLYFRLRNQIVMDDKVIITLNNFKKVGKYIYCYERCQALTDDLRCMHHSDGKQPLICKYPNKDSVGEDESIYVTKNCLWRNKHE